MPYLAFDLDALDNCPAIAAACGLKSSEVSHGLLHLWKWCWREKTDKVTTTHIHGFFGVNACEALLAFGHIAASADGWRVRGAKKYLKVGEARSRAGKTSQGNLKRGKNPGPSAPPLLVALPETSPGTLPAPAGGLPENLPGTLPALQPAASSQQPAAVKGSVAKKPATPDPRAYPLQLALEADFEAVRGEKYKHSGAADTMGLKSLLPIADDEKIRDRWKRALRRTEFPRISTFAQLASKWPDLSAPAPPTKGSVIHGQTEWGPNDDFLAGLSGSGP